MKVFSADYLDALAQQAESSPRLRQHRNVHRDYQEPCQRLFNAMEPDSYIQPHRHAAAAQDELLVAIRGLLALITFDDQGQITHVLHFGSEKYGAAIAAGAEVPWDTWHTVVALEPGSILLEVKAGPVDPGRPKEFATWAPEETSEQATVFLDRLRAKIQHP